MPNKTVLHTEVNKNQFEQWLQRRAVSCAVFGQPLQGAPTQHSWILNTIGRNWLLGHRQKIAKFVMSTFTCRSTFLYDSQTCPRMLALVKILRIKALCGTSEDSKASRGFMALNMRIKYLPRLDDKGSLYGAGWQAAILLKLDLKKRALPRHKNRHRKRRKKRPPGLRGEQFSGLKEPGKFFFAIYTEALVSGWWVACQETCSVATLDVHVH